MEKAQEKKAPLDIIGKYYDTLSQAEKKRFWKYVYGDAYTMEQAEEIEVKFISGTLHFKCERKTWDIEFPEFEAFDAIIKRGVL